MQLLQPCAVTFGSNPFSSNGSENGVHVTVAFTHSTCFNISVDMFKFNPLSPNRSANDVHVVVEFTKRFGAMQYLQPQDCYIAVQPRRSQQVSE